MSLAVVHILPFYPWTSDDGFSVVDYRKVDSDLGDWDDISSVQYSFRLMFDGVINHISAQSEWFTAFLRDDPQYRKYFIVVEGDPDLSQVVRPRTLPLLTEFTTASGVQTVWTTFSADQIDLNYANPDVLLDFIEVLLFYVAHRAELIRHPDPNRGAIPAPLLPTHQQPPSLERPRLRLHQKHPQRSKRQPHHSLR